MVESIKELRKICQRPTPNPTLESRIRRFFSIYLTRLLLYTPITANQVDYIRILFGISAGLLFALDQYWLGILAAFMMQSSHFLDWIDGEVARYRKSESLSGQYTDILAHTVAITPAIAGISIANPSIAVFGFSAILFHAFYHDLQPLKNGIIFLMLNYRLREEGKIEIINPVKSESLAENKHRILIKGLLPIFNIVFMMHIMSFAAIFNFLDWVIIFYGLTFPLLWIIFTYRHIMIGVKPYGHFLK